MRLEKPLENYAQRQTVGIRIETEGGFPFLAQSALISKLISIVQQCGLIDAQRQTVGNPGQYSLRPKVVSLSWY